MKTTVVTVSNREPSEPYYRMGAWKASLARFGAEPVVLGMHDAWNGLVSKPRHLLKWLRSGACNSDCLIFTDSWDVLFVKHPDEIAAEWDSIGRPWICGAERALFPPADASVWPVCATPYRFLNSGAIISTPSDMLKVLEAMNPDALPDDHEKPDGSHFHSNDQEWLQQLFLKQPIPMLLDTECRFIWNLCDVPHDRALLSDKDTGGRLMVVNRDTGGTHPGILHANGGAKEGPIFLTALRMLGLE